MTVRLGFAVAACIQPEILLVDEVLAVGDAAFQQKCLKRIRSLIDAGTAIIFVSHNFYLMQAVCNSALYLKQGQVKALGQTKDVIDIYDRDLHEERARRLAIGQDGSAGGGDELEITHVDVTAGGTVPVTRLASAAPASIRIHYTAHSRVGRVHASVFIMRSDGMTCCMMRTRLDDFALDLEQGGGVLSVDVRPLQLVSGTYYAEAWFLNDSDSMAIVSKAGRSEWFTVQGAMPSSEDNNGIFEPMSSWRIEPVTAGDAGSPASLTNARG